MAHESEFPPCHLCGQEADTVIDGVAWCASCLHARGSCCAESEMEECDEQELPAKRQE